MNAQTPRGPQQPAALLQRIWQLAQHGQLEPALAGAEELTRRAPGLPEGWFAASYIRLAVGQRRGALEAITTANRLRSPPAPAWQLQEMLCLVACLRRQQAIGLGRALVDADIRDPGFFTTLSKALYGLQQFASARRAQERALKFGSGAAVLHLGLASIDLALGDLDSARAACDRALGLDPGNPEAIHFRAGLGRKTLEDNHVPELRELLQRPPASPVAHARLLYALAKELEDLGEYEESLGALDQGARLYRRTLRFDLAEELAFIGAIAQLWTRQELGTAAPAPAAKGPMPVFVTGLPRTGTTLVERILSAHSRVCSAGELPDFSRELSWMMEALPQAVGKTREGMVACSTDLDLAELGRRYMETAAPLAGGSPFFIDKFPQNALYLGLIHRALPEAKLVLVWRHPMDTCFSMYKQLFTNIYEFSYDLDELGRYYAAYRALMKHWVDTLGDRVHVVHYEDLVADQERESRRLVDFCGLPWEPACLEFHRNPSPTSTASASQVRQAMYSSSVGKWRFFQRGLRSLEARLREAGCLDDWRL